MKDLSTIETSMTYIIQTNHDKLDICTNKIELINVLKSIFSEHNLDTPASRRLILNVGKKPNFQLALQTVYDSMLFGANLSVNQK